MRCQQEANTQAQAHAKPAPGEESKSKVSVRLVGKNATSGAEVMRLRPSDQLTRVKVTYARRNVVLQVLTARGSERGVRPKGPRITKVHSFVTLAHLFFLFLRSWAASLFRTRRNLSCSARQTRAKEGRLE
jgi:hypothetical protein